MVSKIETAPTWPITRIGGVAGIGFTAIIVGSNLLVLPAGAPTVGTEFAEATAFFTEHAGFGEFAWAWSPLAWVLVIVFGAGVFKSLRHTRHADAEAWALVGLAGLILQTGTFAGVIALRFALTALPAYDNPGAAALWTLHNALFNINGAFLATAMLGLSIGGLRAGLIRPWHASLGFIAATLQLVWTVLTPLMLEQRSPLSLLGLIGWILWVVWIIVWGVTLIRLRPIPLGAAA